LCLVLGALIDDALTLARRIAALPGRTSAGTTFVAAFVYTTHLVATSIGAVRTGTVFALIAGTSHQITGHPTSCAIVNTGNQIAIVRAAALANGAGTVRTLALSVTTLFGAGAFPTTAAAAIVAALVVPTGGFTRVTNLGLVPRVLVAFTALARQRITPCCTAVVAGHTHLVTGRRHTLDGIERALIARA